jgi:hypothetical protein
MWLMLGCFFYMFVPFQLFVLSLRDILWMFLSAAQFGEGYCEILFGFA